MQNPADKIYARMKQGCFKTGRPKTGKNTGIAAGLKRNARELGAPVLRRDPTVHEKLYMPSDLERRMKEAGVSEPKETSQATRKAWEATS